MANLIVTSGFGGAGAAAGQELLATSGYGSPGAAAPVISTTKGSFLTFEPSFGSSERGQRSFGIDSTNDSWPYGVNSMVAWSAIPGPLVRYGLCGLFTTDFGSTRLRLYAGGHDTSLGASAPKDAPQIGKPVLERFTTGTEFVAVISDFQYKPDIFNPVTNFKDPGYFRLAFNSTLPSANVTFTGLSAFIQGTTSLQGMNFNINMATNEAGLNGGNPPETVFAQWLVDFDAMGNGNQVAVFASFAGFGQPLVNPSADKRNATIRIGGNSNTPDGAIFAIENLNNTGASTGAKTISGTGPRPTGLQWVKFTLHTADSIGGDSINTYHFGMIVKVVP